MLLAEPWSPPPPPTLSSSTSTSTDAALRPAASPRLTRPARHLSTWSRTDNASRIATRPPRPTTRLGRKRTSSSTRTVGNRTSSPSTPWSARSTPSSDTASHPTRTFSAVSRTPRRPASATAYDRATRGRSTNAPSAPIPSTMAATPDESQNRPSLADIGRRLARIPARPNRMPDHKGEKARPRERSSLFKVIPAASYSPTRLPVQYHRLRRA